MSDYEISIIVPCYNCADTINRTVQSLIDQTADHYQIVLVDDGSTDDTPGLCDAFSENDPRMVAVHQENKGLMEAWKRGVRESEGKYIAFSDADDYLERDFISRIGRIIHDYSPDLILFGIVHEYTNGERVYSFNRLAEGYYDSDTIKRRILPNLLSDGDMQSELICKSRCAKVFSKEILQSVIPILNGNVSMGEDMLTMFGTMQVVGSVYCMGEYSPYHYIRNSDSMIGKFDRSAFEKIDLLYSELEKIACQYSYEYPEQLMQDRLSTTLLQVKKTICKSTEGYTETMKLIDGVRESSQMKKCISHCSVRGYSIGRRMFALMFMGRLYAPMYYIARMAERIRGRDV